MIETIRKSILGISAYYHDAAAALLRDGELVAAAQEERFTRKKHDAGFPRYAIEYCLEESELEIGDLDFIVFYDKPLVKFERLLETYLSYAPNGFRSFVAAMPIWLKEKLFLKDTLKREPWELQKECTSSAVVCRASPISCRISVLLQPLRKSCCSVSRWCWRVGNHLHLGRRRQRSDAAMGDRLSALFRPPLFGVHLLHRIPSQLR